MTQTNKIPNLGMCGRCYDNHVKLVSPTCRENPEDLEGLPIGQYHCPECGAMVVAGIPHPQVCEPCARNEHPEFDGAGKETDR